MENYLTDPYLTEITSKVTARQRIKKLPALAIDPNIFYPGGGGQPNDLGRLITNEGAVISVTRALKQNNNIWLCLGTECDIDEYDDVTAIIDWNRRYRYMQYHSAAHCIMGSIRRKIHNYIPKGIEINEKGEGCILRFDGQWKAEKAETLEIINQAADVIKENRKIRWIEYDSIDAAVNDNKDIYRGPTTLTGPVRIIVIEGWDANPCGGTHLKALGEIGKIELLGQTQSSIEFKLT